MCGCNTFSLPKTRTHAHARTHLHTCHNFTNIWPGRLAALVIPLVCVSLPRREDDNLATVLGSSHVVWLVSSPVGVSQRTAVAPHVSTLSATVIQACPKAVPALLIAIVDMAGQEMLRIIVVHSDQRASHLVASCQGISPHQWLDERWVVGHGVSCQRAKESVTETPEFVPAWCTTSTNCAKGTEQMHTQEAWLECRLNLIRLQV